MQPNTRFILRWYIFWVACFMAAGAVAAWSFGLGILAFLILMPLGVLAMLSAGAVFTWHFAKQRGGEDSSPSLRHILLWGPGALLLALVASWQAPAVGGHLAMLAKLALHQSEYRAIMSAHHAASTPAPAGIRNAHGIPYQVDAGPPARFLFDAEGLLDNLRGVVFDPTGMVTKAGSQDTHRQAAKLFGRDRFACNHLWGDYYDCRLYL